MKNEQSSIFFSVIIPVYNRPAEVGELLESLTVQTYTNFEVLIIDDGSTERCEAKVESFRGSLDIRYFYKENSGQGFSRNYGFERADGDYFVLFDSDCLLPNDYFETVNNHLNNNRLDAYGGPDKAHPSFTPLQKAISYAMTSPLTTGGIRGKRKHAGTFRPRSFNMGISREVFEQTDGFKITQMGEDIEFSLRIKKEGFITGLIPEAFVYHKRRTQLSDFFRQLHFFGRARINISRLQPGSVKLIHALPALFLLFSLFYVTLPFWFPPLFCLFTALGILFCSLIALDAVRQTKDPQVASLSIITSFAQLWGYGSGFIRELFNKLFTATDKTEA